MDDQKTEQQKLDAAIETSKKEIPLELKESSALKVEDMDVYVKPHLYQSSLDAMSKKVSGLKDRTYEVRFLGVRSPTGNLTLAGQRLAALINDAVGAFQVIGCLGSTLRIDLFTSDLSKPESAFLVYLAFSPEAAKIIDTLVRLDPGTPFFDLGGVPKAEMNTISK